MIPRRLRHRLNLGILRSLLAECDCSNHDLFEIRKIPMSRFGMWPVRSNPPYFKFAILFCTRTYADQAALRDAQLAPRFTRAFGCWRGENLGDRLELDHLREARGSKFAARNIASGPEPIRNYRELDAQQTGQ